MSRPARYPTDIVTFEGDWERIHRGHGLDPEIVAADYRSAHGLSDDALVPIREVHFAEMPRVKWCGRHTDPCEGEGDWHRHWYEVKPGTDPLTRFTIAGSGCTR